MRLQVLVAAVNEEVNKLAEKMGITSEAVIVNQCDHFGYCEYQHRGKRIQCFSMAERGVGLSRNTALMRADGDICLFSDEDIVFDEGYEEAVVKAFEENPKADIITFNFRVDISRATYHNEGYKRIRWYSYGRYPTYAVAARTAALHRVNVSFSLLFGGGAKYSNGEDSLFLHDCLKKGLRLYASPVCLGQEVYRESTWFKGYNEKFFIDRGVLYHHLYGMMAKPFSLRFLAAHRGEMLKEMSFGAAYRLMKRGIAEGKGKL